VFELDINEKIALIFGTEATGLSPRAEEMCDEFITYPMFGFTESLNISVSVSLCLGALIPKLHTSNTAWQLTEREKDELRLEWYKKSVSRAEVLEKEFLKKLQ